MSIVYRGKTLAGSYLTDLAPLKQDVESKADASLFNLDLDGNRKVAAGAHVRSNIDDIISGDHAQYYYEVLLDEWNTGWDQEYQWGGENYETLNGAEVHTGIFWTFKSEDENKPSVKVHYPMGREWEEGHEYPTWTYIITFFKRSENLQGTWSFGDLVHTTTESGELFKIALHSGEDEDPEMLTILELDYHLASGEYLFFLSRMEGSAYELRIEKRFDGEFQPAVNTIEASSRLHYGFFGYFADVVADQEDPNQETPGYILNVAGFHVPDEMYFQVCSKVLYRATPNGLAIIDPFWTSTIEEFRAFKGYCPYYTIWTEEAHGMRAFRLPLGTLYGNMTKGSADLDLSNISDHAKYMIAGYGNAIDSDTINSWQVREHLEANFVNNGTDVYQNDIMSIHCSLCDENDYVWRESVYQNPTSEPYPHSWIKIPVNTEPSYFDATFYMTLNPSCPGSYMGGPILSTGKLSDAMGSIAIEQTSEGFIRAGIFTNSGFVTLSPVGEDMPISNPDNVLYKFHLTLSDNVWTFNMQGADPWNDNSSFNITQEYRSEDENADLRMKYNQIIFGYCNGVDWYEELQTPEIIATLIKFDYGDGNIVRPYKAVRYELTSKGQKVIPVDEFLPHRESFEVVQELREQNKSEYYAFFPLDGTDEVIIPQKAALDKDNGKISPAREFVDSVIANKWGILDYTRYATVLDLLDGNYGLVEGSIIIMPNGNMFSIPEFIQFSANPGQLLLWDCDANNIVAVNSLDCYSAGQTVSINSSIYWAYYATGYAGAEYVLYLPIETISPDQVYEFRDGQMVPASYEILEVSEDSIRFNTGYIPDGFEDPVILNATRAADRDVEYTSSEPYYYYRLEGSSGEMYHRLHGSSIHKYLLGSESDGPIDTNGYSLPFAYVDPFGKLHINNLMGFFGGSTWFNQGVQISIPLGLENGKPRYLKGYADFPYGYECKNYDCTNQIQFIDCGDQPAGIKGRFVDANTWGASGYRVSATMPFVDDGFYNHTAWFNPELNDVKVWRDDHWEDYTVVPISRVLKSNEQGQISHMQVLLPRDASDLASGAAGFVPSFVTQMFAENEEGKWSAPGNGWWTVEVHADDSLAEEHYMQVELVEDPYSDIDSTPTRRIQYSSNNFRAGNTYSNTIFASYGSAWFLGFYIPDGVSVKLYFTYAQEGDI